MRRVKVTAHSWNLAKKITVHLIIYREKQIFFRNLGTGPIYLYGVIQENFCRKQILKNIVPNKNNCTESQCDFFCFNFWGGNSVFLYMLSDVPQKMIAYCYNLLSHTAVLVQTCFMLGQIIHQKSVLGLSILLLLSRNLSKNFYFDTICNFCMTFFSIVYYYLSRKKKQWERWLYGRAEISPTTSVKITIFII